jgi:hypothetical protein
VGPPVVVEAHPLCVGTRGAYSSDREHVFHAMMNGARWKVLEFQFLRQVFTFGQGLVGFRFGF